MNYGVIMRFYHGINWFMQKRRGNVLGILICGMPVASLCCSISEIGIMRIINGILRNIFNRILMLCIGG